MAVMNTGLSLAGLRADFMERLSKSPTYWQDLATQIKSTTASETYRWLGSTPAMREWGTGRLAKGLRSESYSVANNEYEATIEVERKEIEDDQLGGIKMRIGELATNAANHKDFLIEELLKNGESAGYHSYDGVPFFSESHVSGDSGSQSNLLTYNASNADNPTATEFRAAMTQAISKMVAYKDDIGQPIRIRPNGGFVAIVPPTMLFTALDALGTALVPTDLNPLGNVNTIRNVANVISMPGLTDASKFYLAKVDVPVRPFIFQDRVPLEFTSLESDSETGFIRNVFLYGVRARYRMTYGYWQYCIRTDFT